jgi:hypothetical protein
MTTDTKDSEPAVRQQPFVLRWLERWAIKHKAERANMNNDPHRIADETSAETGAVNSEAPEDEEINGIDAETWRSGKVTVGMAMLVIWRDLKIWLFAALIGSIVYSCSH